MPRVASRTERARGKSAGLTLVFVGPDPKSKHIAHAGGQLTATSGFAAFAAEQGLQVAWVDTAQSNFPVPPVRQRITRSAGRLRAFTRLIASPQTEGAVLFASGGLSFVERGLMALIARVRAKPTLLMIRSGHFRTQYGSSALMRTLTRLLLKVPTVIGAQGESWVPFLERAGVERSRIAVIPNWLSHPPYNPHVRTLASGERLRVLFAGWMTASKGVPELIDALRQLPENFDVILTMAGGGTLLDQAKAAAKEPNLRGKLIIAGWQDRDALASLFDEAHLLVLPSHAEGFPNVVMEALAEGLPVIATAVGAVPDSIHDGVNGAIVPIANATAIAEAIRHYREHPENVKTQSRAALEIAKARHGRDTNCCALLAALFPAPEVTSGDCAGKRPTQSRGIVG